MSIKLGKPIPQTKFNKPIYGLHGEYTLSPHVTVPYLNASIEIERAVLELRTYDQIPPNLEQRWSLEELYQREIDYDRIEKDIVNGYLKDPNKLKFFNAITILLFPKNPDGSGASGFQDYEGNDPRIPYEDQDFDSSFGQDNAKRVVFGGVQYVRLEQFGRLRWDLARVDAVAVDGQHRLAALRKWYESKQQTLEPFERKTVVPILFLLINEKIGFKMKSEGNKSSMRAIAREIFTDLNKNAKKVDEAREIILDDKSLTALCARTLVTRETCKDDAELLPLSLVRWQEANNRFDQSYYLNSLLNLHQLVDLVLNLKVPNDPLDEDEVGAYIQSLDASLGGESKALDDGDVALSEYYKKNYFNGDEPARPFLHLPESYLKAAVSNFEALHKPYILKAIRDFAPYARVLESARQKEMVTGFFAKWNAQPEDHKSQLGSQLEKEDTHWKRKRIETPIDQIQELKGLGDNESWSFKVIFQKALVRLMRLVAFEYAHESERLGTPEDVLKILGALEAKGFFRLRYPLPDDDYSLWTFIGLNPTNLKIKATKKVETNIFWLLTLIYYANRKYVADTRAGQTPITDPATLLRYFYSESSLGQKPRMLWPQCDKAANGLLAVFENAAHLLVRRPSDIKETRKKSEARKRLTAILAEGCVEFAPTGGAPSDNADDSADSADNPTADDPVA
ncbi:MAG TPA: DNA sulfur modification protein DndB [Archangium sp.]|uniref:DNA sulfur modification protein DndB n=1 Tax=Archangium sp. TaxID=1872627 RepID=UPI002E3375B7|nr:DNA sulfur modification protein DndB [Archangium sp.]HEX5754352.1 DNA sulfur modification protein DndB [Archangium sp.]